VDLQPVCPSNWSLSTPHGIYATFQMAEVAVPQKMFQEILRLIARAAGATRTSMRRASLNNM